MGEAGHRSAGRAAGSRTAVAHLLLLVLYGSAFGAAGSPGRLAELLASVAGAFQLVPSAVADLWLPERVRPCRTY